MKMTKWDCILRRNVTSIQVKTERYIRGISWAFRKLDTTLFFSTYGRYNGFLIIFYLLLCPKCFIIDFSGRRIHVALIICIRWWPLYVGSDMWYILSLVIQSPSSLMFLYSFNYKSKKKILMLSKWLWIFKRVSLVGFFILINLSSTSFFCSPLNF